MHIVTLTEEKYKIFSRNYENKHYMQTIEYANVMKDNKKRILYLGLEDNNYNVVGAVLIIEEIIKVKYKIGYAPCGFLIDYNNTNLYEIFTNELKQYLNQLNYIYLKLNPIFNFKIFDKKNLIIKYDANILDRMKKMGYVYLENDNNTEKFNAILHANYNTNEIYEKFNRSIKRKIKDSNLMGITYYQDNDIEKFYSLIEKKHRKENINYYKNLMKYFKDDECKFELYFAKINPEIYLNNYRYILKKEQEKNDRLQTFIIDVNIHKTKKLISNKMTSDKLINKYKKHVIEASNIFSKYPDGLILGACAIIRYGDTIYFIEEGYEEKFRNIHSLNMLKWEIIKKYINLGYKNFNLGIVPNLNNNENKYNGIYMSKICFNPNIYEYCGDFELVTNKYIYTILKKISIKK